MYLEFSQEEFEKLQANKRNLKVCFAKANNGACIHQNCKFSHDESTISKFRELEGEINSQKYSKFKSSNRYSNRSSNLSARNNRYNDQMQGQGSSAPFMSFTKENSDNVHP